MFFIRRAAVVLNIFEEPIGCSSHIIKIQADRESKKKKKTIERNPYFSLLRRDFVAKYEMVAKHS